MKNREGNSKWRSISLEAQASMERTKLWNQRPQLDREDPSRCCWVRTPDGCKTRSNWRLSHEAKGPQQALPSGRAHPNY